MVREGLHYVTSVMENEALALESASGKLKIQRILQCPAFWATARLIGELGYQAELLGRWVEGCPCHSPSMGIGIGSSRETSPKIHIGNCRWKACRAPELASGDAIEMVMTSFELSEHHMASYLADVPESQQHSLRADSERARSTLMAELMCKFGYWRLLPHVLCGLGHANPLKARQAAIRALELWENGGPSCAHVMTQRFLDPNFSGMPGNQLDEPLRPYVS